MIDVAIIESSPDFIKATNGKPILCVVDFMPVENKTYIDNMQKSISAYTKTGSADEIASFFEKSDMMYVSKNKKQSLI